ncbi:MAG: transposase family protein [Lactobacillales bacterium]|nr:transposase family protein [Lactobacillales bacterium]
MLKILESAFKKLHKQGGCPSRLSILDKLVIMLSYYHDYRTMQNIAFDYGVSKSRICDAVKWVEDVLIKNGTFALPGRKALQKSDVEYEVILNEAFFRG